MLYAASGTAGGERLEILSLEISSTAFSSSLPDQVHRKVGDELERNPVEHPDTGGVLDHDRYSVCLDSL